MVFGEVRAQDQVLDDRREAVSEVAVPGHAASTWIAEPCELVIRVQENHDVGSMLESLRVASLLVAPVPSVVGMNVDVESEIAGERNGATALASSTRISSSAVPEGISASVFSSVPSAWKAGIVMTILLIRVLCRDLDE